MPYYLNKVTGKVEKVTKLQKQAVLESQRAEALQSLLGAQFTAPTGAVLLGLIFGPLLLAFLAKQGIEIADKTSFVENFKTFVKGHLEGESLLQPIF
jgi:hypothetical protein